MLLANVSSLVQPSLSPQIVDINRMPQLQNNKNKKNILVALR